jgi:hypothetical protein
MYASSTHCVGSMQVLCVASTVHTLGLDGYSSCLVTAGQLHLAASYNATWTTV